MGILTFGRNWINWTTSFVGMFFGNIYHYLKITFNLITGIVLVSIFKKPLCRIFWTLITVGGIAAFTVQSVFLIQEYLQYGKTTNMQVSFYCRLNLLYYNSF